ncbi:hypothetical protein [Pectinatus frisingensis]|uniref:hypothetical protein n=1 Tax=Pectinatus frisingensis TaxID=865 RepID=UPI0018C54AE3|nr:hypothetical protein [Pectinatus frisingensis]
MDKNGYDLQVKRVSNYQDLINARTILANSLQKAGAEGIIYVGGIGIHRKRDPDSFDAILYAANKYIDTLDTMIRKI